jgi:hypothetical protein
MAAKNISGLRGVFGDGTNLVISSTIELHPGEQGQGSNASDDGLSHLPPPRCRSPLLRGPNMHEI